MSEADRLFDSDLDELTDTEYQYDDPEEMYRVRRIKAVLDALERYQEGSLMLQEKTLAYGRHDSIKKMRADLALSVLRELEPIVRRTETALLESTVTISEASYSLDHLLDTSGVITTTKRTERYDANSNRHCTETREVEVAMSREACDRMVRLCRDFLEEIMPVSLVDNDNVAAADYSDVDAVDDL